MLRNATRANTNHLFLYCVLHVLQLLESVGSVNTVRSVLKHILDLVVFAVPFPKLSKTLLKVRASDHIFFCTVICAGLRRCCSICMSECKEMANSTVCSCEVLGLVILEELCVFKHSFQLCFAMCCFCLRCTAEDIV